MKSFVPLMLAAWASAANIRIDVGQSGLTFSPSSVNASKGDTLEYHFHSLNHSVVQGDFNNPCKPAASGGFYSGFMPTSSGENPNVFQVTVNSTEPIFFYCSQNTFTHCKSGMSGVVNPTSSQTLASYQNNAQSVDTAVSPPAPFGGVVVTGSGSTASSSTSAPAATTSCSTPNSGSGGYRRRDNACGNGASNGVSSGAVVSIGAVLIATGMSLFLA